MRQPRERLQHGGEVLLGVLDRVVADQRRLVGGDADHRLLELHLDQPALGAELDDVALDLDRHPGHQLGPLQDRQHVVEDAAALELEHGQPGRRPGRAGRGTSPASPGPGWPWPAPRGCPGGCTSSPRRRARRRRGAGRSRPPARSVCFETRSAVRWRVPVSRREDRRVRHQLHVGPDDLGRLGVEHDRAVHLRHLVEHRRRVVDVELDPAGEQVGDVARRRRRRSGRRCWRGRCCRSPRAARRQARRRRGPSEAGDPAVPKAREAHPRAAKTSRLGCQIPLCNAVCLIPSGQVGMAIVKRIGHLRP